MKQKSLNVRVGWILLMVYLGMVALAVYLNPDGLKDKSNFIVNCVFFVVVGIMFTYVFGCFMRTNKLVKCLNRSVKEIKTAYESNGLVYLWDTYKNRSELFGHTVLDGLYCEYTDENNRLSNGNKNSYQCDIEDYINRGVIDRSIRKNILNLVPGTMTGLGILGTFVGLSFGLNSFSTGTTEEITQSISPLMSGIKVAFHTSIYGMVFSLVFSFVYKYKLQEAYAVVEDFLNVFSKYVVPDAQNENMNGIFEYQKQQAESSMNLVEGLGEIFAQKMSEVMSPLIDKMDTLLQEQKNGNIKLTEMVDGIPKQFSEIKKSLKTFADGVTDKQIEGINLLVDKFLDELNDSVDEQFDNLSDCIKETCEIQRENNKCIKKATENITSMSTELAQINSLSVATVKDMAEYVDKMESLQGIINDNFMSVNMQLSDNISITEKQQKYLESLLSYESKMGQLTKTLDGFIGKQTKSIDQFETDMEQRRLEFVQKLSSTSEQIYVALATAVQNKITSLETTVSNVEQTLTKEVEQTNKKIADSALIQIQEVARQSKEAFDGISQDRVDKETALSENTKILLAQLVKTVQGATNEMNVAKSELEASVGQSLGQVDEEIRHAVSRIEQAAMHVHRAQEMQESGNNADTGDKDTM